MEFFLLFQKLMMKTTDALFILIKFSNPSNITHTFTHACSPMNGHSWSLFRMCSMQRRKGKKKQLVLMVTVHTFSINIKNNLHKTYKFGLSLLSLLYRNWGSERLKKKKACQRSQSSWTTEVGLIWLHLISHCLSREKSGVVGGLGRRR